MEDFKGVREELFFEIVVGVFVWVMVFKVNNLEG